MFKCNTATHDIHSILKHDSPRHWLRQHCATDSVDVRSQFASGETCYDLWQCADQDRGASDDECKPLAKGIHGLPLVTYADICTLVHYDNDVNPGLHGYEAEGTALNMHDITGSAHSRITQCLKSTKPPAGIDQGVT
eukprot:9469041-Pyramimonas_sp.AAC.1